ncbi:MAG TPA: helix-turn-helix domain-containing protein [Jatrophihabitans sp.]|nr:helix-turn-helix domain-containing protein [Jatrophihabitans sp.]
MRAKTANHRQHPGRVAVLTYDELSMFEFAVACEIFGSTTARLLDVPWYELVVCGDRPTVRFDNGMSLPVPKPLAAARRADTIILPPCEDAPAVSDATLRALVHAHARGARIITLCTGAFVLARTGLLDGRRAVTHWDECETLALQFPHITVEPGVLYVDEGDILTSAGSAASIDLCLHVVRCDLGADIATALARRLVVQPHRDGGQAQYIDTPMPTGSPAEPIADALAWMTEHLAEEMTVADLATRSLMSQRSFARHFVAATGATPYQWLLRQRIQHAQRLLERTDLPVDAVAERVGLANATNLRKHFRRLLDTSPHAYRRAFRTPTGLPG